MDLSGSAILITGGAGFIGSHLAKELLKEKYNVKQVIALDSLGYGKAESLPLDNPRLSLMRHELGSDSLGEEDLKDVEYVFHLAAEKHNQSKETPDKVFQSNIMGMHNLLDKCTQTGVKKVLFTSSLYAYGRMNGKPMKEDEYPKPQTIYGISKLAGENLLDYFHTYHDLNYNVLRYFFVYGPNQYPGTGYKSVIIKNFERMLGSENPIIYGDGEQTLDYIFIDDVLEATIKVMLRGAPGDVYNVGRGQGVSINELIKIMKEIADFKEETIHEPPDWTANSARVGDVNKIASEIDFSPKTPLTEGLKRTYQWLQKR